MAIDDFRTHRARVRAYARNLWPTSRAHARLNLPAAAAFSAGIARPREGFRTSTRAHTREKGGPATLCTNCFVTSTQARARPEFREQYARPREGASF